MLVAGACGFLGSHFVDRAVGEGYRITGIDDLSTGSRENITHTETRIRLVEGSITDADTVLSLHDPKDPFAYVVNFASPASPVQYRLHPIETLRAGSLGVDHLASLASRNRSVLLHTSTSEVYGDPLEHPQSESYNGNVDPIGPRSCYDEAKRFAEALLVAHERQSGLSVRIARIFNTYGPRMDPNDGRVVSTFIRQSITGDPLTIHGSGAQTRSFCYVSDMIEGLWRLLHSDVHGPVNLGNPQEVSIETLAHMILSRFGGSRIEHLLHDQGDPVRRRPDISLARERLGWAPLVDLPEGIDHTYHWMREYLPVTDTLEEAAFR